MAEIDLDTFNSWMRQIQEQPPWRARADREADYYDGNQLDAEVLRRQRELGIPPAIEPMIQPTINTILGLEVKQRPDWKVVPDDDEEDDGYRQEAGDRGVSVKGEDHRKDAGFHVQGHRISGTCA